MFSKDQQDILQAMGFVLYEPVPQTAAREPVAAIDSGFWQSPFGRNIARCSADVDPDRLTLAADARSREAKKDLWRQLKALRKLG